MLNFNVKKPKTLVSEWVPYKEGARLHIAASERQAHVVGQERDQVRFNKEIGRVATDIDRTLLDMVYERTANYLLLDWEGVKTDADDDGKFTPEKAFNIMRNGGDEGLEFWHFIQQQSERIQREADERETEYVGKP